MAVSHQNIRTSFRVLLAGSTCGYLVGNIRIATSSYGGFGHDSAILFGTRPQATRIYHSGYLLLGPDTALRQTTPASNVGDLVIYQRYCQQQKKQKW